MDFTKSDKTMLEFFIDVTEDYYREMIQHMRETGVKIPVAGTNWTRGVAHLSSQVVQIILIAMPIGIAGGGKMNDKVWK